MREAIVECGEFNLAELRALIGRSSLYIGGGYYGFNPGENGFGFHAGVGLQVGLTRNLSLEAGYEYHHAFLKGIDGEFSGLQVGVSLGF